MKLVCCPHLNASREPLIYTTEYCGPPSTTHTQTLLSPNNLPKQWAIRPTKKVIMRHLLRRSHVPRSQVRATTKGGLRSCHRPVLASYSAHLRFEPRTGGHNCVVQKDLCKTS